MRLCVPLAKAQPFNASFLLRLSALEGGTGKTGTEVVESTPSTPPVIGRKELKEAAEKKRQIKEQVQYEKKQQAKKKR